MGAQPSTWASGRLGLTSERLADLIRSIKRGLPFSALDLLAAETGFSVSELAAAMGIPPRTLARRKTAGKLSADESERVVRVAGLFEKALALFDGDEAGAQRWMRLPKEALDGESPIEFSSTEIGAREVENLIGRLEHGVFS
jgi:putative toxin-antitoxin system antitoxin component (TIGR02293 family)